MSTQGQENYGGASGKDDGGLTTGGDGREEMAQAQNQVPSTAGIENRATTDALPDDDLADGDLTGAQMDSAMDGDGAGGNPLDDDPQSGSMGTDITGGSGQGGMVAGDAAGAVGSEGPGSSISGDAVGAAAGADIDPAATTQGSDRSDDTPGYGNSAGYDDAGQSSQGGAPGSDGTSGMSSEGMNSGGAGSGASSYGGSQGQGQQQGGQQAGQQQQSSRPGGFKTQGEKDGEQYADDLGDGASASSAGGGL